MNPAHANVRRHTTAEDDTPAQNRAEESSSSTQLQAKEDWMKARQARLHAAVEGYESDVNLLDKPLANAPKEDLLGRSALSYAAENGSEQTVKSILLKPASQHTELPEFQYLPSVGGIDLYGRTPLSYAAAHGNKTIVELLIKAGANDAFIPDYFHQSPLLHAASNGHDGIVKHILEADPNHDKAGSVRALGDNYVLRLANSQWPSLRSEKERAWWLNLVSFTGSIHEFKPTEITSSWAGFIRLEWELPAVMEEMKRDGRVRRAGPSSVEDESPRDTLARFVILTGSDGMYECATLEQFLARHFHFEGRLALGLFSKALSMLANSKHSVNEAIGSDGIRLVESSKWHVTFSAEASCNYDKASFIEACAWILSAVRLNPDYPVSESLEPGHIYSSKTELKTMITGDGPLQLLSFTLGRLCELPREDLYPNSQCWRQLFQSGIVASYALDRKWGQGMKMPFDMMVQLAAVENYYHIDGGTILHGFDTALVPIQEDRENGLQWHLETVSKSGQSQFSPHNLRSIQQPWFQTKELEILTQTPCYVGWFPVANVVLGSRDLVERNQMSWSSGLRDRVRTAHRRGFEAGTQISFTAGPISITPNVASSWTFHSNIQRFNPSQQYIQAIRLSRSKVALVIDTHTKQAWLIPLLSLILHLCHIYFQDIKQDREVNHIPFAEPSPDGASAVINAIEQNGDLIVTGRGIEDPNDPKWCSGETLRQMFLRISTNLLETSAAMERPKGNHIFASELMDLMHEPVRGSHLKEIEISAAMGSWQGLVEKVDVIGCCARIGRLIEPVTPVQRDCQCHVLPENQFLMGAHMRCLDELARRAGSSLNELREGGVCKFGDKAFWCAEKWCTWAACGDRMHPSIWTDTLAPNQFLHQITQKEVKQPREQGQTLTSPTEDDIDKDDVVVFGGYSSRRMGFKKVFADLKADRLRRPMMLSREINSLDTVQLSEQRFPNISYGEPAYTCREHHQ